MTCANAWINISKSIKKQQVAVENLKNSILLLFNHVLYLVCFLYVVTCADRLHFSSAEYFISIKLIYNWGILFSVIWTWSMHWSLIFFYKFCIIFIWCQKMDRTQYMHIEMWQELRTHWSWFECMMLAFNYLGDLHFKWVWPLKSIKCWCVNRTLRHIWIHYHIHSIDN
jgi:hypothetical protein